MSILFNFNLESQIISQRTGQHYILQIFYRLRKIPGEDPGLFSGGAPFQRGGAIPCKHEILKTEFLKNKDCTPWIPLWIPMGPEGHCFQISYINTSLLLVSIVITQHLDTLFAFSF